MNKHERNVVEEFFYADFITEIVQPIKSGKEATVYLCRGSEMYQNKLVCLKIYKDFSKRGFKRTDSYQEGRFNGRQKVAVKNKSKYGKELMQNDWISSEFEALNRLHNFGINVPKPLEVSSSAILMDYIGDEYRIANQLKDEELFEKKSRYLFKKIIFYIQEMFDLSIIHGDLSPYNILVWKNRPVLIDFPQFINPEINSSGFNMLYRDVNNICKFFGKRKFLADSRQITEKIWNYEKINMEDFINKKSFVMS